jgi:hypothetical protein
MEHSVPTKSVHTSLITLAVAAALAGGALAASARVAAPHAGDVDGFGSTAPSAALAGFVAKPLYRERQTGGTLKQVTCASAATGDTSVCYATR